MYEYNETNSAAIAIHIAHTIATNVKTNETNAANNTTTIATNIL